MASATSSLEKIRFFADLPIEYGEYFKLGHAKFHDTLRKKLDPYKDFSVTNSQKETEIKTIARVLGGQTDADGRNILHNFATDDAELFGKLLALGVDPDVADKTGLTPGHHAVENHRVNCLQLLYKSRAGFGLRTSQGLDVLGMAEIRSTVFPQIDSIDCGDDVKAVVGVMNETAGNIATFLRNATATSAPSLVRLAKEKEFSALLHILRRNCFMVDLAEFDERLEGIRKEGSEDRRFMKTAEGWARLHDRNDVGDEILYWKGKVTCGKSGGLASQQLFAAAGSQCFPDYEFLRVATDIDEVKTLLLLLEDFAVRNKEDSRKMAEVTTLLENNDNVGYHLLETLANDDDSQLGRYLAVGFNPDSVLACGTPMLHFCVMNKCLKCLKLLLTCNADTENKDEEGNTAWTLALKELIYWAVEQDLVPRNQIEVEKLKNEELLEEARRLCNLATPMLVRSTIDISLAPLATFVRTMPMEFSQILVLDSFKRYSENQVPQEILRSAFDDACRHTPQLAKLWDVPEFRDLFPGYTANGDSQHVRDNGQGNTTTPQDQSALLESFAQAVQAMPGAEHSKVYEMEDDIEGTPRLIEDTNYVWKLSEKVLNRSFDSEYGLHFFKDLTRCFGPMFPALGPQAQGMLQGVQTTNSFKKENIQHLVKAFCDPDKHVNCITAGVEETVQMENYFKNFIGSLGSLSETAFEEEDLDARRRAEQGLSNTVPEFESSAPKTMSEHLSKFEARLNGILALMRLLIMERELRKASCAERGTLASLAKSGQFLAVSHLLRRMNHEVKMLEFAEEIEGQHALALAQTSGQPHLSIEIRFRHYSALAGSIHANENFSSEDEAKAGFRWGSDREIEFTNKLVFDFCAWLALENPCFLTQRVKRYLEANLERWILLSGRRGSSFVSEWFDHLYCGKKPGRQESHEHDKELEKFIRLGQEVRATVDNEQNTTNSASAWLVWLLLHQLLLVARDHKKSSNEKKGFWRWIKNPKGFAFELILFAEMVDVCWLWLDPEDWPLVKSFYETLEAETFSWQSDNAQERKILAKFTAIGLCHGLESQKSFNADQFWNLVRQRTAYKAIGYLRNKAVDFDMSIEDLENAAADDAERVPERNKGLLWSASKALELRKAWKASGQVSL